MKKIKFAKALWKAMWIYWIIYNFYFGFNQKPINIYERYCDNIFVFGIVFALYFYIKPYLGMYEKAVKEEGIE